MRRQDAAQADRVAVDRAPQVAGDEVALVRAVEVVARAGAGAAGGVETLAAYSIRTSQVPVRSTAGGGRRLLLDARRLRQHGEEPLGHDLLVARGHHVGADREARLAPARPSPRAGKSEMRGSLSKSSFATASPVDARASPGPSGSAATGMRFESPSGGVTEVVTPAIGRDALRDVVEPRRPDLRISASWSRFIHISTAISIADRLFLADLEAAGEAVVGRAAAPRPPSRGPCGRAAGRPPAGRAGTCRRCR